MLAYQRVETRRPALKQPPAQPRRRRAKVGKGMHTLKPKVCSLHCYMGGWAALLHTLHALKPKVCSLHCYVGGCAALLHTLHTLRTFSVRFHMRVLAAPWTWRVALGACDV